MRRSVSTSCYRRLPQVGEGARKTNVSPFQPLPFLVMTSTLQYDYTKGQLGELIDVIIEEKTGLFVCAIGVPPKHVVDRLHAAGIPVMNV